MPASVLARIGLLNIKASMIGAAHPMSFDIIKNYILNQKTGGLPLPDMEILRVCLEGLPTPPSETAEGNTDSQKLGV